MRRLLPILAALAAVLAVAGCGSSSKDSTAADATTPSTSSQVASATASDFPAPRGKRLSELRAGMQEGLVLAPSVSVFQPGSNRYGFALFDAARKQVSEAPVALYVSRPDGSHVRGPFVARSESLAVGPQFQSKTTTSDPDAAQTVYVADVEFPKAGKYRVSAIANLDGRHVSTTSFEAGVDKPGTQGLPPAVGEQAPKVKTPTLADVAGDAARIETRQPAADELLKTNLADVYGKKPVALLFATPALCQSRVCGPVVDIMAQVQSELGSDKVAFIHNEIYKENRVDQGLRPEPARYRIPTEPWLFVLDRNGRVAERIEGAFSPDEMKAAIKKAQQAG